MIGLLQVAFLLGGLEKTRLEQGQAAVLTQLPVSSFMLQCNITASNK